MKIQKVWSMKLQSVDLSSVILLSVIFSPTCHSSVCHFSKCIGTILIATLSDNRHDAGSALIENNQKASLCKEHQLIPRFSGATWDHIHNNSFSSYLTNGPNKLECYISQGWNGLSGPNTLDYWDQTQESNKVLHILIHNTLFFTNL